MQPADLKKTLTLVIRGAQRRPARARADARRDRVVREDPGVPRGEVRSCSCRCASSRPPIRTPCSLGSTATGSSRARSVSTARSTTRSGARRFTPEVAAAIQCEVGRRRGCARGRPGRILLDLRVTGTAKSPEDRGTRASDATASPAALRRRSPSSATSSRPTRRPGGAEGARRTAGPPAATARRRRRRCASRRRRRGTASARRRVYRGCAGCSGKPAGGDPASGRHDAAPIRRNDSAAGGMRDRGGLLFGEMARGVPPRPACLGRCRASGTSPGRAPVFHAHAKAAHPRVIHSNACR